MYKLKKYNQLINHVRISRKAPSNKVKTFVKYVKMKKKLAANLHL